LAGWPGNGKTGFVNGRFTGRSARWLLLIAGAACAAALASQAVSHAVVNLTAIGVRIGDHPGFVRAVVDFTDGRLEAGEVMATDPSPFADGAVLLRLDHRRVLTDAPPAAAHGVSVRLRQGANRVTIRLTSTRRRFKYVSYSVLRAPERLVIDLWKAAPPSAAAETRAAPDRCLTLTHAGVGAHTVAAAGRERNLFEHSLVVRLRGANGRVLAQRPETAARARWRSRFRYPSVRRQTGTLEAVADSAKDGSLDCLVQARVRVGA
jgi:immunoglobulin-like protein involved in spore germination